MYIYDIGCNHTIITVLLIRVVAMKNLLLILDESVVLHIIGPLLKSMITH